MEKLQSMITHLTLLFFFLGITVLSVSATHGPQEHAFGYNFVTNVRGNKMYLWVPSPPNGLTWTAGIVPLCENLACSNGKFVETGWIKGTAFGLNNRIRQFVSYKESGVNKTDFVGSDLNSYTWYAFKVLHSNSANRWEAWRGSSIPWYKAGLGWNTGNVLAMGAEAADTGAWMDAYGWHPEYKVGTGSWTLYNYSPTPITTAGACMVYAYDFGFRGYSC